MNTLLAGFALVIGILCLIIIYSFSKRVEQVEDELKFANQIIDVLAQALINQINGIDVCGAQPRRIDGEDRFTIHPAGRDVMHEGGYLDIVAEAHDSDGHCTKAKFLGPAN
ncbi:MAG: hypothetical protein WCT24_00280 [Patescibacteria group bacterium]|jgi:hypothetical protein